MRPLRLVLTALLAASSLVVAGCTKKEKQPPLNLSSDLSQEPLLRKLPSSAAAFSVIDIGGEGYKLFRKSPYSGASASDISANNTSGASNTTVSKESLDVLVNKIEQLGADADASALMKASFETLIKLDLMSPAGKYTLEKVISRLIVFGGSKSAEGAFPVELGVFVSGVQGVNLRDKIKILQSSIANSHLQIGSESFDDGAEGFPVFLPNVSAKLFIAATPSLFGASLSKTDLQILFNPTATTSTLSEIQALPEYKRAASPIPATEKPLAFTFASINRLLPLLERLAKTNDAVTIKVAEIPIEGVVIKSSFPQEYVHNLGFAVTPRTPEQVKIATALESSALPRLAYKIPSDTAISASIDTRVLKQIDSLIQSIQNGSDPALADQFNKLAGVTLGLRNNLGGAPLPDVFFSMQSSDRQQSLQFLESSLGKAMSLAGQNATWQKKVIEGTPVTFFNTLIGAGIYMAAPKDSEALNIGTSEAVLRDLLAAQSGKVDDATKGLSAVLSKPLQSSNVASFYINFNRVADVLDSVKSTLSMLTGGNAELNTLIESTQMRSWGLVSGGVTYAPGVMVINSTFDAVRVKQ